MTNKHTQKMTLLEAFKHGEILSARMVANKYNIDPFSQRIKNIEEMGYIVNRAWVYGTDGRKSHMEYWIGQDQFRNAA